MASDEPTFSAFNSFGLDDLPVEAVISQRMLRRLENIGNVTTAGPANAGARSAGIRCRRARGGRTRDPAHRTAKTPDRKGMMKPAVVGNDSADLAQQVSVGEAVAR
jgi:hypothetical protein